MASALRCDICDRVYTNGILTVTEGVITWDLCSPSCLRALGERKSGHLTSTPTVEVSTLTRDFFNDLRWCALTAGVIEVKAGDEGLLAGIIDKLAVMVEVMSEYHDQEDDDEA
jgi:hypothetical protein